MRYDRMSGLDAEQLDELVRRIEDQLEEPWHKGIGRPKDLTLREAVVVACGYARQNITQEVWAEIFDTSQPVISGIITKFTPLIEASTEDSCFALSWPGCGLRAVSGRFWDPRRG